MAPLVWLVTGCSSGFGEAFVHRILDRGDKVIATARSLPKIEHLSKTGASILQLDVTDTQGSLNDKIRQAIEIHGRIDVLVNNAAFVAGGSWEDLEEEDFVSSFNTNVFGVIKVTRAVLPHFRGRKSGTSVFISSLSGWIGDPFVGAYAGSKFALEGLVEALAKETGPLGIRTLLIQPGRFRTNLLTPGNLQISPTKIADYIEGSKAIIDHLTEQDMAQPGDVNKGVNIILDLVRGEGVAAEKEVPLRLPLGTDCYDSIKKKCEETLTLLEGWKDVITSTDHTE